MKPKTFRKSNKSKRTQVCKFGTAREAIGTLEHDMDVFILTYGQFSLIDGLMAILDQTGPAHVSISTWTAAHADLTRSASLLESGEFLSFRMIVDRSFPTRQPAYYQHMINLFGSASIRTIRTHAKYLVVKNEKWNIVIRTSMNLNTNPRLENMEISDNKMFANFFKEITDNIFAEIPEKKAKSDLPKLENIEESNLFNMVSADTIKRRTLNEPRYTHTINKH